jgi:hypothetical protein
MYIYVTCVATGVCIARYESNFNTAALSPTNPNGSRDNGIFQVSNKLFYNNKTKPLVSIKKPHAWSIDSLQKVITANRLSKLAAL